MKTGSAATAVFLLLLLPVALADTSSGNDDGTEKWGYIDVRPGAHMFWWLYYTDVVPVEEAPLVMWFQGGPGASSVGFGNFEEIGPLTAALQPRENTWLKAAHLLFVDNPVGAGFSYVDDPGLLTTTNQEATVDSVSFLQAFFSAHDSLRKAPFYIVSESYGGKFASELGVAVHELLVAGDLNVNFKGVALGNTWISPIDFLFAWGPLLKAFSLVDGKGTHILKRYAEAANAEIVGGNFLNATSIWANMEGAVEDLTDNVDFYNLLKHETDSSPATGFLGLYSRRFVKLETPDLQQTMNGPIKKKLGIIPSEVSWGESSSLVFEALGTDFMKDTINQVDKLLELGVNVTIYSGQLDLICCTAGTDAWVQKLKWPHLSRFNKAKRKVLSCNRGETAAFFKEHRNLKFYWILNAGHMVPSDNPCMALKMIRRITEQSVPDSRNASVAIEGSKLLVFKPEQKVGQCLEAGGCECVVMLGEIWGSEKSEELATILLTTLSATRLCVMVSSFSWPFPLARGLKWLLYEETKIVISGKSDPSGMSAAEMSQHLNMSVKPGLDEAMQKLFKRISGAEPPEFGQDRRADVRKVTIVGVGNVGMACAQTIISQELCNELALVDVMEDKLKGEMMDLQHAAAFIPRLKISASMDYAITAKSQICLITAGVRQEVSESRRSLVDRNVLLLSKIVPQLVRHSPDTILLLISNPVDILTYVAWKISGLPSNRVIGSGTNLDSSRFRFILADQLQINARDVHGFMIGEHGDRCFPVRSSVSVAGVPLSKFGQLLTSGKEIDLFDIQNEVISAAYEVIKLKGYTNWAIGYSAASLVRSILSNQKAVHPVSVNGKGVHGIKEEVFLSLPCVLARNGAECIVEQILEPDEHKHLEEAVSVLWSIQKNLSSQADKKAVRGVS